MCSRALRPIGFPIYVARRPAAPFIIRADAVDESPQIKNFTSYFVTCQASILTDGTKLSHSDSPA